jgi:hypothetical protein
VLAFASLATPLPAQVRANPAPALPPAIEDNSFFIEEGYNQEKGVVQHISTFLHFRTPGHQSDYSFTQEWPVQSQAHQLSYTIPYAWPGASSSGVGDVLLNYRYQLAGHDGWAAVSPRLSLILPTGGDTRGSGSTGLQVNLPASRRVSRSLVVHANGGATFFPRSGERFLNLGASAIALVTPRFNLMLEIAAARGRERDEAGLFSRTTEVILSPGLRFAIDRGGLQVVPGVALPIRFSDGRTRLGAFAYLSFEHPFAK